MSAMRRPTQRILELLGDDPFSLNSLRILYQAKADFAQAAEMLRRSIAVFPGFFRQHLNLATLNHEMHRYARAVSCGAWRQLPPRAAEGMRRGRKRGGRERAALPPEHYLPSRIVSISPACSFRGFA
jgi:hypothetical protein